jgi:hypothetical protein
MNTEQFPPGVYDILNGINNTRIARVLSLSTTLPTAPGVNWQPNMEHWFTTASLTNLQTAFSISAIKAKYAANLTNLNVIATELADPTKYKFQLYAKGVLTVQDWISGVPAYNTPAYYFVQNSPPVPTRAMRPLFEVPNSDPSKLANVTWMTLDNTVTNYFANVGVGTTVTLGSNALSLIPANGWYYRAP